MFSKRAKLSRDWSRVGDDVVFLPKYEVDSWLGELRFIGGDSPTVSVLRGISDGIIAKLDDNGSYIPNGGVRIRESDLRRVLYEIHRLLWEAEGGGDSVLGSVDRIYDPIECTLTTGMPFNQSLELCGVGD